MSNSDYRPFVKPDEAPRLSKADAHVQLDAYPPFLERLVGMWAPLAKEPFKGITTTGEVQAGLFSLTGNGAPTRAAAEAAHQWLDSLGPDQRRLAQRALDAEEWRHWQNTPLVMHDQLEFESLSAEQRAGALEVVRRSLSERGFERVLTIMENNEFLGQLVGVEDLLNRWAFTLTIFGQPSTEDPWGWQLFGHHLAINAVFIRDQMVMTPVFMGMEPDAEDSPARRRIFLEHETRALAFMKDLNETERGHAVLYSSMLTADQPPGRYHPDDGRQVGGAFQDNRIVPYEGLAVAGLSAEQKRRLLGLAELFIDNLPGPPAEASLREIEQHLGDTHFAWIGRHDEVNPFYFRIHSPVALIEFDHHSGIFLANREPERFHAHTIVRTPNGGDFGKDLLRQHYAGSDHGRHQQVHAAAPDSGTTVHAHSHDGGTTFHSHD